MSSRPFSDSYDLRLLGAPPVDIKPPAEVNPHRYMSPAETQRLVDACLADDRRADADEAAFLARHGVQWGYADCDDDVPPPFVDHPYLRGLLHGIGLAAMVVLVVAMTVLGPMLPR